MTLIPAERQSRVRERQKARVAALEEGALSSVEMGVNLAARYRQAGAAILGEGEAATAFLTLPNPSAEDLATMVEAAGQEADQNLWTQLEVKEEEAQLVTMRERVSGVLPERGELARRFLHDRGLHRDGEPRAADHVALMASAEADSMIGMPSRD